MEGSENEGGNHVPEDRDESASSVVPINIYGDIVIDTNTSTACDSHNDDANGSVQGITSSSAREMYRDGSKEKEFQRQKSELRDYNIRSDRINRYFNVLLCFLIVVVFVLLLLIFFFWFPIKL